jgi:hypothetical protein
MPSRTFDKPEPVGDNRQFGTHVEPLSHTVCLPPGAQLDTSAAARP